MSFPTTQWTRLAAATLNGDSAGRDALAMLCRDYRGPVLAFLRIKGYDLPHAEDLAQEFFLELIRSRAWKRADQARGRFRTFLLGTLNHVISHEREHAGSLKRGGGRALASLDEFADGSRIEIGVPAEDTLTFDRGWAMSLMESAMATVQKDFEESGRAAEWTILVKFLPGAGETPAYEEAAAQLGMSLGGLKSAVYRVRQQLRDQLRTAVARTVSGPNEIAGELAYLHQVMVQPG